MSDRVTKAAELHKKGYNCAQAVACAYCDLFGAEEKEVFRLMEGFGLGMGDMKCTCGAVSGAIALAGIKNSDGSVESPKTKGSTYKIAKAMHARFREEAGSTICKELKGIDTGKVLMPCPACIDLAVELAEEMLSE